MDTLEQEGKWIFGKTAISVRNSHRKAKKRLNSLYPAFSPKNPPNHLKHSRPLEIEGSSFEERESPSGVRVVTISRSSIPRVPRWILLDHRHFGEPTGNPRRASLFRWDHSRVARIGPGRIRNGPPGPAARSPRNHRRRCLSRAPDREDTANNR